MTTPTNNLTIALVNYFAKENEGSKVKAGRIHCAINKAEFCKNAKTEWENLERKIANHIKAKSVSLQDIIWGISLLTHTGKTTETNSTEDREAMQALINNHEQRLHQQKHLLKSIR